MHLPWRQLAAALLLAATVLAAPAAGQELPLGRILLPPGFAITLYARVPGARSLAVGDRGTVFVGTRERDGRVYAVTGPPGQGRVLTLADGLDMPNGVAFRDGALYVAEVGRILRFDDIERHLDAPPPPVVVTDRLPHSYWHGWRHIAFGPDGWLYVPVGAPCNVCEADPDRYAIIARMQPDGSRMDVFARGVRNSVGFDWDPRTGELWFNDHGRDDLGDDLPSDELNHAPRAGMHFGFPYCHQGDTADPVFGARRPCDAFEPPVLRYGAHVAADGLRFYTGRQFPPAWRGRAFVAEHGSWNRSSKVGYRIVSVDLTPGRAPRAEVFAQGWLDGQAYWGRPTDLLVMPDGALLVSDDHAGALYRITYGR